VWAEEGEEGRGRHGAVVGDGSMDVVQHDLMFLRSRTLV